MLTIGKKSNPEPALSPSPFGVSHSAECAQGLCPWTLQPLKRLAKLLCLKSVFLGGGCPHGKLDECMDTSGFIV